MGMHLMLVIAMAVVAVFQGTNMEGPAANLAVLVGTLLFVMLGVCACSENCASSCSDRYSDSLVWIGDLCVMIALVMAVGVLSMYALDAPPFYAMFPLVLFAIGNGIHVYSIYDAQTRARGRWIGNMQVPLQEMGRSESPGSESDDDNPFRGPPTVGVIKKHRRTASRVTKFEIEENPFDVNTPRKKTFSIGDV